MDTATTEIYTLSLHDALPIFGRSGVREVGLGDEVERAPRVEPLRRGQRLHRAHERARGVRSEEHTSELQSQSNLVCRLLLEKKKNETITTRTRNSSRLHIRPS